MSHFSPQYVLDNADRFKVEQLAFFGQCDFFVEKKNLPLFRRLGKAIDETMESDPDNIEAAAGGAGVWLKLGELADDDDLDLWEDKP